MLDSLPVADASPELRAATIRAQRQGLAGTNGSLYYPWVAPARRRDGVERFAPPCGHVAGVYARVDDRAGVHKAPANERLEDALDLEHAVSRDENGDLNDAGVNCIRAFPGRGIRVWGARTLSRDRRVGARQRPAARSHRGPLDRAQPGRGARSSRTTTVLWQSDRAGR